ncbi:sulfite exporter TauE/SafE family protein [uncultured Roseibium sp.]|uniref:sulfite exporter TauE/SafE family protein n=1 Tax=uncultured Roseibium sp. TaxID=1936171 RepID=UPI0026360E4B|nr:sulfite exporter TauE/SafE family protein [uncultured Roseibium sp.]
MQALADWIGLPPSLFLISLAVAFLAGAVRGFTGFGLSAVVMASMVVFLPPVDLIPICFLLETAASLVMFRGGFRDADRRMSFTLAAGSAIGTPLGLLATTSIPSEISKAVALALVLALSVFQFFKVNLKLFEIRGALPATGILAGIATGLASVGGMVIALYVLGTAHEARKMRASLVLYLFASMAVSFIALLYFGVLNETALRRGIALAPAVLAGVFLGSRLFSQRLQSAYKSFCLGLLIMLSCAGVLRLFLA